jgi:hypothetical protein
MNIVAGKSPRDIARRRFTYFRAVRLPSRQGALRQGWVLVSLVTLFFIGIIGQAFTAPRFRALLKTFEEKSRDMSAACQNRRHDPILLASVRFRIALVLGVVLLMVSRLNLRLSLVTMACAAALASSSLSLPGGVLRSTVLR